MQKSPALSTKNWHLTVYFTYLIKPKFDFCCFWSAASKPHVIFAHMRQIWSTPSRSHSVSLSDRTDIMLSERSCHEYSIRDKLRCGFLSVPGAELPKPPAFRPVSSVFLIPPLPTARLRCKLVPCHHRRYRGHIPETRLFGSTRAIFCKLDRCDRRHDRWDQNLRFRKGINDLQ